MNFLRSTRSYHNCIFCMLSATLFSKKQSIHETLWCFILQEQPFIYYIQHHSNFCVPLRSEGAQECSYVHYFIIAIFQLFIWVKTYRNKDNGQYIVIFFALFSEHNLSSQNGNHLHAIFYIWNEGELTRERCNGLHILFFTDLCCEWLVHYRKLCMARYVGSEQQISSVDSTLV